MLRRWDNVLTTDSAAAALFEVWYRLHLREAIVGLLVGHGVGIEAVRTEDEVGDSRVVLDVIGAPDAWLGRDSWEAVARTILSSLGEAVEHVKRLLGDDQNAWKWGDLHHAYLAHALSPAADEETRRRLDVGPTPRGGSGDTVGNTAHRLRDFRQTGGSSFRIVVDVGRWDGSLFMNSPGQSGDPGSGHYDDLFPTWAHDGSFPLLYSRTRVEEATERRIVLEPKGARSAPRNPSSKRR